jgi:hypothetical protein
MAKYFFSQRLSESSAPLRLVFFNQGSTSNLRFEITRKKNLTQRRGGLAEALRKEIIGFS